MSKDVQQQIEQHYPHLFKPEVFEFRRDGECYKLGTNSNGLPFMIGWGLVDIRDQHKCLVVDDKWEAEIDYSGEGKQIIRFIRK